SGSPTSPSPWVAPADGTVRSPWPAPSPIFCATWGTRPACGTETWPAHRLEARSDAWLERPAQGKKARPGRDDQAAGIGNKRRRFDTPRQDCVQFVGQSCRYSHCIQSILIRSSIHCSTAFLTRRKPMKHLHRVTRSLPVKAAVKGDFKSCGPLKDFLGL